MSQSHEGFTGGRPAGTRRAHDYASVIVSGVDGSDHEGDAVDKYLAGDADVWHFLPNLAGFLRVLNFIDKNPKIVLVKTRDDILVARGAGEIAIVFGSQDGGGLTEGNVSGWRSTNLPSTRLRQYC